MWCVVLPVLVGMDKGDVGSGRYFVGEDVGDRVLALVPWKEERENETEADRRGEREEEGRRKHRG